MHMNMSLIEYDLTSRSLYDEYKKMYLDAYDNTNLNRRVKFMRWANKSADRAVRISAHEQLINLIMVDVRL